jgi:hypothetical protein
MDIQDPLTEMVMVDTVGMVMEDMDYIMGTLEDLLDMVDLGTMDMLGIEPINGEDIITMNLGNSDSLEHILTHTMLMKDQQYHMKLLIKNNKHHLQECQLNKDHHQECQLVQKKLRKFNQKIEN